MAIPLMVVSSGCQPVGRGVRRTRREQVGNTPPFQINQGRRVTLAFPGSPIVNGNNLNGPR